MRVTVLAGGPSTEREVSLRSGAEVAAALIKAGHVVTVADINPTDVTALSIPADVIFPVLHGEFGESGELQVLLEDRRLPFVGSGSAASRIGFDKVASKKVWQENDLPTPRWRVVTNAADDLSDLGLPLVVKANRSGSSIDVFICQTAAEATAAAGDLIARHGSALVEQFVQGIELTVGLLDGQALTPIRIETDHMFFDYDAKYTVGGSKHSFTIPLPGDVISACARICEKAGDAVGYRHLARVDLIVNPAHGIFLLEINTMPGFTRQSLLPEAAAEAGIDFPKLVDDLVRWAMEDADPSTDSPPQQRRARRAAVA